MTICRGEYVGEFFYILILFLINICLTSLPQSTTEVERTLSKLNANKTKLRSFLAVRTLEAIIKMVESFPSHVDVNARLTHLYTNARKMYMEKYTENEQKRAKDFQ